MTFRYDSRVVLSYLKGLWVQIAELMYKMTRVSKTCYVDLSISTSRFFLAVPETINSSLILELYNYNDDTGHTGTSDGPHAAREFETPA